LAPYSACVSSLPTSQRFCVVLMARTQARGSAGSATAGASTARVSPGRTQRVATETRTQRAGGRAASRAVVVPAACACGIPASAATAATSPKAATAKPRLIP
jgi:hypothetical protein